MCIQRRGNQNSLKRITANYSRVTLYLYVDTVDSVTRAHVLLYDHLSWWVTAKTRFPARTAVTSIVNRKNLYTVFAEDKRTY